MSKTYIVGIAGESASGKSTISDCLAERLTGFKIKVIHADDYFKLESERPVVTGITNGKVYIDDNHPNTLELERFHMDVETAITQEWDLILLEGIFILWDEKILPLLDLKIYVDCDSDERLVRRIKRHISFGQDFDEITERYIQAVRPRQREYVEPTRWKADLILNGFSMPSLGVEIVLNWLYKMMDCKDMK